MGKQKQLTARQRARLEGRIVDSICRLWSTGHHACRNRDMSDWLRQKWTREVEREKTIALAIVRRLTT